MIGRLTLREVRPSISIFIHTTYPILSPIPHHNQARQALSSLYLPFTKQKQQQHNPVSPARNARTGQDGTGRTRLLTPDGAGAYGLCTRYMHYALGIGIGRWFVLGSREKTTMYLDGKHWRINRGVSYLSSGVQVSRSRCRCRCRC